MTAPTPAQIEAAARAMYEMTDGTEGGIADYRSFAEAALTAAAEVGEPRMPQMVAQQSARLEAQYLDLAIKDAVDAAIDATIERCAQVAEAHTVTHGDYDAAPHEIAAAIRVLKDKP